MTTSEDIEALNKTINILREELDVTKANLTRVESIAREASLRIRREFSMSGALGRDLVDMGMSPCASINNTGSVQGVGNQAWTKITMNTTLFDYMNGVDLTNDRIYARRAGIYLAIGQVYWASGDVDGSRFASVYVNGVATEGSVETGGYASVVTEAVRAPALAIVNVTVDSYFELFGYQSSGGNLNTVDSTPRSFLSVLLVSRGNT